MLGRPAGGMLRVQGRGRFTGPASAWWHGWAARCSSPGRAGRPGGSATTCGRAWPAGDDLLLFPEGTSSDGCRVLPFRSGLLLDRGRRNDPPLVQPISLVYDRLGGLPTRRGTRAVFAWYGDMNLARAISGSWRSGAACASAVLVHPPLDPRNFPNRKKSWHRPHGNRRCRGCRRDAAKSRGPGRAKWWRTERLRRRLRLSAPECGRVMTAAAATPPRFLPGSVTARLTLHTPHLAESATWRKAPLHCGS